MVLLMLVVVWGCQTPEELPEIEESYDVFSLIDEGLNSIALDVRAKGGDFGDLDLMNESIVSFVQTRLKDDGFDLMQISTQANTVSDPELGKFIDNTRHAIEEILNSVDSYNEFEQQIYNYVDININSLSKEQGNVLILITHLELIYTDFLYHNSDLIPSIGGQGSEFNSLVIQRSGANGCCSWDEIKKWAKCAVGVVSGTVTGTVSGCVGVGGLAFQITGGIAALPVSGEAAITGCVVGGVLGGLAGAGIGAVNGGCFD